MAKTHVKAAENKGSVLGTFTGKCCDTNVMNNNDMHLGKELFENLLDSAEYKRALKNRHYISFLGHPENPDCQDFEHACMVMTDLRLLDNGDVEGDFDLIDTPVGRIVKAFIDAGVNFGISIRGLGDVDGNGEVDPEGFIFRGFDLVTFPAYDDCIPEFKAIAASTDAKKKAAYKKICASIDTNLPDISSPTTLEVIKEQLADGSDEFNQVQNRIDELTCEDTVCADLAQQKIDALTELYLDAASKNRDLEQALAESQIMNHDLNIACATARSNYAHLKKIVANQIEDARNNCESLQAENNELSDRCDATRRTLRSVRASLDSVNQKLSDTQEKYDQAVEANTKLKKRIGLLQTTREKDKESIEASNQLNLKYQRKIEANSETISQKDSALEDLKKELHETVMARQELESEASNLDEKCNKLLSRVEAAEEMVFSYQQAYANMYANALGIYLKDLPITASTSVEDLKQMIKAGTSTANISANPNVNVEESEDFSEDLEEFEDDEEMYSAEMVTM